MKRYALTAGMFAATAALSLLSRPASAQTIQMQYLGNHAGQTLDIYNNNTKITTFAGLLSFQLTVAGTTYGPFDTVCVDLDHTISVNDSYKANLAPTVGPYNGGLTNGGQIGYLFNTYAYTGLDNDHAAALQVAVWELLKDNDRNLTTGNFKFTTSGNILTYAQTYLNAAVNQSYNGLWADASLNGAVANHKQSQMLYGSGIGVQDTPEPGTLALLGSLPTVGLAVLRRNRKRNR